MNSEFKTHLTQIMLTHDVEIHKSARERMYIFVKNPNNNGGTLQRLAADISTDDLIEKIKQTALQAETRTIVVCLSPTHLEELLP